MLEGKKLAEEHAEWLFSLLRKIYIEAFEHGYKHGKNDLITKDKSNITKQMVG